jgi:hypothetical protein
MPGAPHSQSALSKGEQAAEIFKRDVQGLIHPEQRRWFLAIDVKTGLFELDEDDHTAISKLLARAPRADGFLMRADGSPAYKMRHVR